MLLPPTRGLGKWLAKNLQAVILNLMRTSLKCGPIHPRKDLLVPNLKAFVGSLYNDSFTQDFHLGSRFLKPYSFLHTEGK